MAYRLGQIILTDCGLPGTEPTYPFPPGSLPSGYSTEARSLRRQVDGRSDAGRVTHSRSYRAFSNRRHRSRFASRQACVLTLHHGLRDKVRPRCVDVAGLGRSFRASSLSRGVSPVPEREPARHYFAGLDR